MRGSGFPWMGKLSLQEEVYSGAMTSIKTKFTSPWGKCTFTSFQTTSPIQAIHHLIDIQTYTHYSAGTGRQFIGRVKSFSNKVLIKHFIRNTCAPELTTIRPGAQVCVHIKHWLGRKSATDLLGLKHTAVPGVFIQLDPQKMKKNPQ